MEFLSLGYLDTLGQFLKRSKLLANKLRKHEYQYNLPLVRMVIEGFFHTNLPDLDKEYTAGVKGQ